MDKYAFYTGQSFDDYTFFGAQVEETGVAFRAFAPGAHWVNVVLNGEEIPMKQVLDGNFYEIFLENDRVKEGDAYEFRVYHADGVYTDHCDPYGFEMELRPNHKSIVRDISKYTFHDDAWMAKRNDCKTGALNIYEIHAGSWKKKGEGDTDWYTYDELAKILAPYLKENGYNYVELMPISEHPCDESWGYQNTGFYAPTSRYGTPIQLKEMIDIFHQNEIGVILDFVPVHFAVDEYGLYNFDGTALYEYPHGDVGVSEWGSCNFMHSRGEVRSFLQSCANYWLKEYHFDGLRMDAISRIIYWQGDESRGVNNNAVEFIKVMNRNLKEMNPGCMLIAEDSTNYPNVTKHPNQGGLGFDYKWDMGWMHDTLEYFQTAPEYRRENYHKLTFSMMYYYNENYLLPYSHDEVVHGKATILQKMSGDYDVKFPQGRAMYMYMMVHPGKKLNFMGNEFGQLREWDEKREQDWLLLDYPNHDAFLRYIRDLNRCYLEKDALFEKDLTEDGFSWLDCHQEDKCIYAIMRTSGDDRVAVIFNFSDQVHSDYRVAIDDVDKAEVILCSDWDVYGGNTPKSEQIIKKEENGLVMNLNPFTGVLIRL